MTDQSSMRVALEKCAAALQILPRSERDVIKFTGEWKHYSPMTVAEILDEANTALGTSVRNRGAET